MTTRRSFLIGDFLVLVVVLLSIHAVAVAAHEVADDVYGFVYFILEFWNFLFAFLAIHSDIALWAPSMSPVWRMIFKKHGPAICNCVKFF